MRPWRNGERVSTVIFTFVLYSSIRTLRARECKGSSTAPPGNRSAAVAATGVREQPAAASAYASHVAIVASRSVAGEQRSMWIEQKRWSALCVEFVSSSFFFEVSQ